MSQDEELDETKRLIRATLVSCPNKLTISEFCRQYKDFDEGGLPFRKFDFPTAYDFLRSMPDTVQLLEPSYYNSYIRPVMNENTQHVHKLVQEQKKQSVKRSSYRGSVPIFHRASNVQRGPTLRRGNDFQREPTFRRGNDFQREPSFRKGDDFQREPASSERPKQPQRQRPTLTSDCKSDLLKFIQNYPQGVSWDEFDSHTQRILGNHYLDHYSSTEVLGEITDLVFYENGRVLSTQSSNSLNEEQLPGYEDDSIIEISDSSDTDMEERISSASRAPGPTRNRDNESRGCSLISDRLRDNLRALLMDCEYANGIWLTKLPRIYENKFGYPLSPREHGFANLMDLVANAKTIFHLKQYRREGDYLLQDARKFSHIEDTEEEAHIPRSVVEELRKTLRSGPVYVDDLSKEYRRFFQKELRPEEFGFKDLDQFLQHLENNYRDILFRRVRDQTMMRLNYASPDTATSPRHFDTGTSRHSDEATSPRHFDMATSRHSDEATSSRYSAAAKATSPRQFDTAISMRRSSYETHPRDDTYDTFPPEVCNADFRLEIDPDLAESKVGHTFPVNFGEVHSPGSFYITHLNKMELLENMMADLNEFYATHGDKYRVPLSMVFRDLLCACTYSSNNQWHRVRVLSCTLKYVKLLYIDYGTMEEGVNIDHLRYLHKDFAEYPALCMHARLSGIEPNDGVTYGTPAKEAFYELFGASDLDAEVVRNTPNCLEIILYAKSGGERTAAHEVLLRKKLVRRKMTDIKVSRAGGKSPLSRLPSETLLRSSSRNSTLSEETLLEKEETASFESKIAAKVEAAAGSTRDPSLFLRTALKPLKPPPGFPSSPALLPSQSLYSYPQSYPAQTQTIPNPFPLMSPSTFHSYYNNPSMIRPMYPPYYPPLSVPPFTTMYTPPYVLPSTNLYFNTGTTPSAFRRPPPGIHQPPIYFKSPSISELPEMASSSDNRVTERGDEEDSSDSSTCGSCLTKKVSSELSKPDDNTVDEIVEKLAKVMSAYKSGSGEKAREPDSSTPRFEEVESIISRAKQAAEQKVMEYLMAGEQNEREDDTGIVPDTNVPVRTSHFQLNACTSEFIPKTKPRSRIMMSESEPEPLPIISSSAKGLSESEEEPDTRSTPVSIASSQDESNSGSTLPNLKASASATPSSVTQTSAASRLSSIRSFVLQREKNNASSSEK